MMTSVDHPVTSGGLALTVELKDAPQAVPGELVGAPAKFTGT